MKEKKIIVISAFNIYADSKSRLTKEWIDTRIDIFMNYTLRSLKAQSNQEFTAYIFYDARTEGLVQDSISKYEKLPSNVEFINNDLRYTKLKKEMKDFEYVYLVRIDCDDMYHMSYIQQLFDFKPKPQTKVIINQKGYLYDSVKKRLTNYYNQSPPFYTLIYKTKEYIDGLRYKLPGGHPGAIDLPHEIIDKRNFIFHAHSANSTDSTTDKFYHGINTAGVITYINKINKILEEYIGPIE
jgi:Protein of unknown function (DUF3118).